MAIELLTPWGGERGATNVGEDDVSHDLVILRALQTSDSMNIGDAEAP